MPRPIAKHASAVGSAMGAMIRLSAFHPLGESTVDPKMALPDGSGEMSPAKKKVAVSGTDPPVDACPTGVLMNM